MMLECVVEHVAIARLENIKWEKRVRKEHGARQRHDRDLLR